MSIVTRHTGLINNTIKYIKLRHIGENRWHMNNIHIAFVDPMK